MQKMQALQRPSWVDERIAEFDLNRILARVEICPDDECWLWSGPMVRSSARVSFAHAGKQVYFDARRLVWELVHGFAPPANMSPRCACNGLCVHPDHLRLVKRPSEPRHRLIWRKRMAAAQEARSSMTLEKARAIRASGDRLVDVAALHGCCVATASKIRRGLVWRESDHVFADMADGWRS